MKMDRHLLSLCVLFIFSAMANAQPPKSPKPDVIAYYTGNAASIDQYRVAGLSHIIFSFCHLRNNRLSVDDAEDSATIRHLVGLKATYPGLKIMLSLGGWGGCAPCSEAFSTAEGRNGFAASVKELNQYFGTDGIDLDWEYPTIPGHPGHLYQPADYDNFTQLVSSLRTQLGPTHEISFAAGGFQQFLDSSIDWKKIMPLVNRVNIMSYDLVNGYATVTGHQTALYSTRPGEESTDNAVQYLLRLGIPAQKLVIGAAFYTRVWKQVAPQNNGLYQPGIHIPGYIYKQYASTLTAQKGWQYHWDAKAQAAYWYHAGQQLFATGDNGQSIRAKANYVLQKKMGGIMFWELTLDEPKDGLLQKINDTFLHP